MLVDEHAGEQQRRAASPPRRGPARCAAPRCGARAASGSTACDAVSSQANTPSSSPSTHSSTQIVMASGSQTSRPAIRYFFTWRSVGDGARRQWQAQELPQPPAGGGAAAGAVDAGGVAAARACGVGWRRRRPLAARRRRPASASAWRRCCRRWKSVAYQPEPLSWKPAAVSCLVNVAAPQAGQWSAAGRRASAARLSRGRTRAAISVDRHG